MAASSITPTFDVGNTVYFVQADVLKAAEVERILIEKNSGGVTIRYDIGQVITFLQSVLYATPQAAVDGFADALLLTLET